MHTELQFHFQLLKKEITVNPTKRIEDLFVINYTVLMK